MAGEFPSWMVDKPTAKDDSPSWMVDKPTSPAAQKAAAEPSLTTPSPSAPQAEGVARAAAPMRKPYVPPAQEEEPPQAEPEAPKGPQATEAYGPMEGLYKYPRDRLSEAGASIRKGWDRMGTGSPSDALGGFGQMGLGTMEGVFALPSGLMDATYGSGVEAVNRAAGGTHPDRREVVKAASDVEMMVPGAIKGATKGIPRLWGEFKNTVKGGRGSKAAEAVAAGKAAERVEPTTGKAPNLPTEPEVRTGNINEVTLPKSKEPKLSNQEVAALESSAEASEAIMNMVFKNLKNPKYEGWSNEGELAAKVIRDQWYYLPQSVREKFAGLVSHPDDISDNFEEVSKRAKAAMDEYHEAAAKLKAHKDSLLVPVGRKEPNLGNGMFTEEELKWTPHDDTVTEAAAKMEKTFLQRKGRPIAIDQYADVKEGNVKTAYQDVEGLIHAGKKLLPPGDHMHIIHAIQKGDLSGLNPAEQAAATQFMRALKMIGDEAQEAGLFNMKKNYVPQMWDTKDELTKQLFERSLGDTTQARSTVFTSHMLSSSIPSYAEGINAKMKPKYNDLWKILGDYSKSVIPAVEQKKMIDAIKAHEFPSGHKAIYGEGEHVPKEVKENYVDTNYPDLRGMRVHKELLPSLQVMLDSGDVDSVTKALQGVSFAAKRMETGWSFFHPMSLYQAWIGSGGNTFKVKSAVDAAHKAYLNSDPTIRIGLQNGLEVSAPLEVSSGAGFVTRINERINEMASKVPGLGKAVELGTKGVSKVDDKFQQFTWEYLHTGMKMEAFSRKYAAAIEKNAKLPKGKQRSEDDIAKDVASFVNSTFGGLNWRRIAESFENPQLREWALKAATDQGKAVAQIAMFAPDWKVSTVSSWTRGLLPSSVSGSSPELSAMHRQYLARSAIISAALSDAANFSMTGHHIWENKADPKKDKYGKEVKRSWGESISDNLDAKTRIEMGDGTHMYAFKHFMEGPHLAMHPGKWILNAMGAVPSEALDQAAGVEYMADEPGKSPPMENRLLHLLKRAAPFSMSQGLAGSVPAGDPTFMQRFGGFFGVPVTGSTDDQKRARKEVLKKKSAEAREGGSIAQ